MSVEIRFTPLFTDHLRKGKSDIWATINYKMFMELEGEFSKADYPSQKLVKLDGKEDHESGIWEFGQEFEYPEVEDEVEDDETTDEVVDELETETETDTEEESEE